jgi:hypothetical protein
MREREGIRLLSYSCLLSMRATRGTLRVDQRSSAIKQPSHSLHRRHQKPSLRDVRGTYRCAGRLGKSAVGVPLNAFLFHQAAYMRTGNAFATGGEH